MQQESLLSLETVDLCLLRARGGGEDEGNG